MNALVKVSDKENINNHHLMYLLLVCVSVFQQIDEKYTVDVFMQFL